MFALTDAGWGFLGILVTQSVVLIGIAVGVFVRTGRNGKSLDAINTAVNHQGKDEPTLVQRVTTIERASARAGLHRKWEIEAFGTLARHVGCQLPPHPADDDELASTT